MGSVGSARPSPSRSQTTDATMGFVAEKMQNRVESVASPKVADASTAPWCPTASWQAGTAPFSTWPRASPKS